MSDMTTLYIKNMVCDRCKAAVKNALQSLGLKPVSVELGIAYIEGEIDKDKTDEIRTTLCDLGFELLEDKQKQIIDRIKSEIIELVHYKDNKSDVNLSTHLSGKLATDYSTLSKLFSESTGMTIERYVILQKIERVKELLFYDEMSVSEIAMKMNYSSTAYLSTQFKSVTGMTPSQFKAAGKKSLKQLDKVGL